MKSVTQFVFTWLFWLFWLGVIVLTTTLVSQRAAGQVLAVDNQMVVEYNAFENAIKLSSKVDFSTVHIMFDDMPGHWLTLKKLRDVLRSQRPRPPAPPVTPPKPPTPKP